MPAKHDTIAVNELARKIGSSVQDALKQAKIHDDGQRPIVLHWDIIGFILREEEALKAELGGVLQAANHVAQSTGQLEEVRAMRSAAAGEGLPAVAGFLPDRRIICGFRPWPGPGPIIKF